MNGYRQIAAAAKCRCRQVWRHGLWLLIAALVFTLPAWAQDQVLVVGDVSRGYVRSYVEALSETLKRNGTTTVVIDTNDSRSALKNSLNYRCIVTVGQDAASEAARIDVGRPVLHALITDTFADNLYKNTHPTSVRTYLLVEQPVERLLLLAKVALPQRKRIGVLYGPASKAFSEDVQRYAQHLGMSLVEKEIDRAAQMDDAILYLQSHADLLITLPDPLVVNEGTVKSLILGAYLRDLPLLGYSQALVKAGAVMGVYSTPEQLGMQSAEMIAGSYWTNPVMNEKQVYPRYFRVSVNYQVARALAIDLPDEETLVTRIRKAEMLQ